MKKLYILFITIFTLTAFQPESADSHFNFNISAATHSPVTDSLDWETVIDSNSLADYDVFEKSWNYLYPWGSDHNGSARMYAGESDHAYVTLQKEKVLCLRASYTDKDEGKSDKAPHLKIKYRSGAVHAKHQVTVSDAWPVYEVSGSFKAPVDKGTWPAFWLTAVHGWPPESDIVEFKGDSVNWQNTFITPAEVTTEKVAIPDAATNWHHYKAVLKKAGNSDVDLYYYIDHQLTAVHRGNFMNQPLWVIINLQMEGSAIGKGPLTDTHYYIRDILVRRSKTNAER